jgi:hypothetical protein
MQGVKPSMDTKNEKPVPTQEEILSFLYPKEMECPVCEKKFTDYAVRKSKLRVDTTDGDLKTRYHVIDPNHYEVQLCYYCGYTALGAYFEKITDKQQDLIKKFITPMYTTQEYPVPYPLELVVNRFDQALACCQAIYAKNSQFAITYLKKAWVLRDMEGKKEDELKTIREAYVRLNDAFTTENFPLGAMDETTAKYLIAEMARRLGNFTEALRWVGDVITNRDTPPIFKKRADVLKELAREGISE